MECMDVHESKMRYDFPNSQKKERGFYGYMNSKMLCRI